MTSPEQHANGMDAERRDADQRIREAVENARADEREKSAQVAERFSETALIVAEGSPYLGQKATFEYSAKIANNIADAIRKGGDA